MVEKLLNSRIPFILWSRAVERGRWGELDGEGERESEIDAELQLQLIIFLSSLLSLSFIISGLFIM